VSILSSAFRDPGSGRTGADGPSSLRAEKFAIRFLLGNSGRRAIDFGRDFEENLPS
jgi:hypothetical protein